MSPLEERKEFLKKMLDASISPESDMKRLYNETLEKILASGISSFLDYLFSSESQCDENIEDWVRRFIKDNSDPGFVPGVDSHSEETKHKSINTMITRKCNALLAFLDGLLGDEHYDYRLSVLISCLVSTAAECVAQEDQDKFVIKLVGSLKGMFEIYNEATRDEDIE